MALNTRLEDGAAGWAQIPNQAMEEGLRRYLEHGVIPGQFLQALLANDLRDFYARADDHNAGIGHKWLMWLHWQFPANAWGSREAIQTYSSERKAEIAEGINVPA